MHALCFHFFIKTKRNKGGDNEENKYNISVHQLNIQDPHRPQNPPTN